MTHEPKNKAPRESTEMFHLVDGMKQDADLHEQILADGDARIAAANKNARFSDNFLSRVLGKDGKEIPMDRIIKKAPLE
jgi:hypothetical protein